MFYYFKNLTLESFLEYKLVLNICDVPLIHNIFWYWRMKPWLRKSVECISSINKLVVCLINFNWRAVQIGLNKNKEYWFKNKAISIPYLREFLDLQFLFALIILYIFIIWSVFLILKKRRVLDDYPVAKGLFLQIMYCYVLVYLDN